MVGINPSNSCSRTVGATPSAGSLAALHTSARKLETGIQLYLHVTVITSMTIHPCMRASLALSPPITCSTQNEYKAVYSMYHTLTHDTGFIPMQMVWE